jgi:hypothetical protein
MTLDLRNTEGMLLKLADEDEMYLSSKFRRAVEQVRAFQDSPDLPQVFERLAFLVSNVPGKSNIYMSLLASLHSTFPQEIEDLMTAWAPALRQAIDSHDENQAVNITLLLSEAVRIGFVSTLAFLSVLMDLISLAEANAGRLKCVAKLIILALPGVFQIFMEKYEMEYKNLLDDLGKLLDGKTLPEDIADERAAFDALRKLQVEEGTGHLYAHLRFQPIDEDPSARPLRKTFKLLDGVMTKSTDTVPRSTVVPRRLVRAKVVASHGGNSPLNILAVSTYLRQLITAFQKNPVLLLERISNSPWGNFGDLKDWLFFELLLDLICQEESETFAPNFLFVCRTVSSSIEHQKKTIFYEQALEELSNSLARSYDRLELYWVARIIKMIAYVNFQAKTALTLASDQFVQREDFYYFVNMFFAIQSRQLSLKAGLADDFQVPE